MHEYANMGHEQLGSRNPVHARRRSGAQYAQDHYDVHPEGKTFSQ